MAPYPEGGTGGITGDSKSFFVDPLSLGGGEPERKAALGNERKLDRSVRGGSGVVEDVNTPLPYSPITLAIR